jgi:ferrous iron transport protein A
MTQHLNEMQPDNWGTIVSVGGDCRLRRRLMAMGVTPGARLVIRKFAPLGDPIEIKVRDYSLSIRRKDAASILVDCQDGDQP